ncbi:MULTISPECIES: hypothetical protein [unclassified Nocardia]|uniref:hypothetical protein n=1 Tax=unclassified Nocardia TaxID=2637762 RepID=UPI00278C4E19|nr:MULTISPECIES: hypothetical protein [unclassified Nocardia]
MPLPGDTGAWPPPPFDIAATDMRVWDAWYTGNVAELSNIYVANSATRPAVGPGGIVGKLQRFFWGRQETQSNAKLHLPAPADLARASADLLFAQPPTWRISTEDTVSGRPKAQKRLDAIFSEDEPVATLLEAAELCSALGGTYLRVWWDKSVSDHVMLGAVSADGALPEWRYNRLAAVTFWTTVSGGDGRRVLRHLERHEPGVIYHGLYEGDERRLGHRIDLRESPDTAWAAGVVNDQGAMPTGVRGLTADFVPNVRPNRGRRTIPGLTQLGRSDFDQLEGWFDALDETYASWMRDIRVAKSRLFVDENLLKTGKPGRGGTWDAETEVYTALKGMGSALDGGNMVQANQFAIRWAEHSQTAAELLNVVLRAAGLSASQFSDSSLTAGVITATEVNARENLSERTRKKKITYWRAALTRLGFTAMQIDAAVFGTGYMLDEPPEVKFPTRSQTSPGEMATSLSALATAHAMSIRQMVVEQHPDWDTPEVEAEVDRIFDDAKQLGLISVPSPDEFGVGGDGDPDNPDEPIDPDESTDSEERATRAA